MKINELRSPVVLNKSKTSVVVKDKNFVRRLTYVKQLLEVVTNAVSLGYIVIKPTKNKDSTSWT